MGQFLSQFVPCLVFTAVQFAFALPWLWAIDPKSFRDMTRRPSTWASASGILAAVAALAAFLLAFQRITSNLDMVGRLYGAVLSVQVAVDFFLLAINVMLAVWPKGGAVALAAFREGIRQPMFWLIGLGAVGVLIVAMVVPYFTFGDDYKMMKQICFDTALLAGVLFGVLGASISINEEIEGRTAVTLMSKPVTRRQFLVGKFLGILMASWALTLLIGWFLVWVLHWQPELNPYDQAADPMSTQTAALLRPYFTMMTGGADPTEAVTSIRQFEFGLTMWSADALSNGMGLVLGFGKVAVLLAIASTLATRMPMVTNLVLCLVIYFLGHLAPVLHRVSEELRAQNPDNTALSLVNFMTQLMETFTPALDYFNMGPAIIRDTPLSVTALAQYVGSVTAYSVVYTIVALLFGLILFEDRDLA
jgi:ABC-type transport system involved in multi-copper enzyme maturation permease subunit